MRKITTAVVAVLLLSVGFQSPANADSDPFPGVAQGAEIPGTRVSGDVAISCPSGSGRGIEVNATTKEQFSYCVKTWTSQVSQEAMAAYRAQVEAGQAAALAQSQAWNAANPGMQKCFQWGPFTDPNGGTSSGGVCANPVQAGAGTTVPSEQAPGVVGPSTPIAGESATAPAALPTNTSSITGNGSPYTVILPGQLSTEQCPAGYQAANGIISAIGKGVFTECWPDLAWKANRLGGTYWEQFKSSGGAYDVTPVLAAMNVIAEYKARAKAVAQAAANLTPGIQRCSTWSVYGETGQECAYTGINPGDTATVLAGSDSSTVGSGVNLDSATASVALNPVAVPVAISETTTAVAFADVEADLSARVFKEKVVLKVVTNLELFTLTVTATKKGSKSIQIPVLTNSDGNRTLTTKANLLGYTLTLKVGTQVLDKITLKK